MFARSWVKHHVARNANLVRQLKWYLAIGVRDTKSAWMASSAALKNIPKQGVKRVDAYYRTLAERSVALDKAFFDARLKRKDDLYKKLKEGKWATGQEAEKKWWAEKRPLVERDVIKAWQRRMFDEMKKLLTIGGAEDGLLQADTAGAEGCKRDWELAFEAWSKVAGEVYGKTPESRHIDLIDYVWEDDCRVRRIARQPFARRSRLESSPSTLRRRRRSSSSSLTGLRLDSRDFTVLKRTDGNPFTVYEVKNVLGFEALNLLDNLEEPMGDGVYMSSLRNTCRS